MPEKENKPRILCVDDEPKNLSLMEALLAPCGYETAFAENGETALASVATKLPDLILLDIMMPKMSGLEVLRRLRNDEKARFIPVVMVTALNETKNKIEALDAGCDEFISKPFDKHEFLARVKSLLRIKFLHDEVKNNYKRLREIERLEKLEAQGELKIKSGDLDVFRKGTIFREIAMIDLKKEINVLLKELGREPKYEEID